MTDDEVGVEPVLTAAQMAAAERCASARAGIETFSLMLRAGQGVHASLLRRFPGAASFDVLCGPGNNGGDGYVVAEMLANDGAEVRVHILGAPRDGTDAERAARAFRGMTLPLEGFRPRRGAVVVDALFGTGLSRGLDGAALAAVRACSQAGCDVVAVDIPSGVAGDTGIALTDAMTARLTVTFAARKPGHVLQPGRSRCGEIVVADIGVAPQDIAAAGSRLVVNGPSLWLPLLPRPETDVHKYGRGHVGVLSGGPSSTGAARLAAMAAARGGAGAVTVLSPPSAMLVNAAHLTAIMVRPVRGADEVVSFVADRKVRALVLGPGAGVGDALSDQLFALLEAQGEAAPCLVLDADVFSSVAANSEAFFGLIAQREAPVVLTPHDSEFARLFPDLAGDRSLSKVDRARTAAARSGAVVVSKGPDTVIAAPDGRAAINANGTPLLATAGSGDVLAGIVAGLAAQGMPAYEAACAAVWMHAEAAGRFGPGLVAEDLPQALPNVLRELYASTR